jgi:two-component system CheB/CheR fusion protein
MASCRNVLIYLEANLQRHVFAVLRYALKAGGVLMLGSSETTGASSELFRPLHRKFRIYEKKPNDGRFPLELGTWDRRTTPPAQPRQTREFREKEKTILEQADFVVLHQVAPPGVVISDNFEIVQFRGRTSRFLEPPPGSPSYNIMKMARQGLLAELRTGVERARRSGESVLRPNVRVRREDAEIALDLEIIPLGDGTQDRHFLVLFKEHPMPELPATADETEAGGRNAKRLKLELEATREYLQSIIEEQETMNEELRSANEEIQSNNEELQSMNEELETAKEELQSSNEELTTLNDELEVRNQELNTLNNDLNNILTSIEIPIVILGSDLRIRRFNPSAQKRLKLIPADLGRPVSDLRAGLEIERLEETVATVIDTLTLREIPVTGEGGETERLQVRPYKTIDNRIDGAVLVLLKSKG